MMKESSLFKLMFYKCQTLSWPLVIFMFLSLFGTPLVKLFGMSLLNKTTLLLAIIYLFLINYKDIFTIGLHTLKAYGLLLLMTYNLISISWSIIPSVSAISVINNLAIFLFALFAGYHAQNKDVAESMKLAFMAIVFLIVFYCIAFPGDSYSANGLRSFYPSKNNLGYVSGLSTVTILMTLKKRFVDYLFLILSVTLLLLTNSRTSIAIVFSVSTLVLVLYWLNVYYKQLTTYTQGFVNLLLKLIEPLSYLVISLIVLYREQIADYLIINIPFDALTGRGVIWATVLARSRDDLLLGLGHASFWSAGSASEINQTNIALSQKWLAELISADGGYIDVIASIGFLGLGLLLVALTQAYLLNFKMVKNVERKLYFTLITFLCLHNITETGFFLFTNTLWFIFVFLTFYFVFKVAAYNKEAETISQVKLNG